MLMTVASVNSRDKSPIKRSWLRESRAAVASSSTMISGRWRKSRERQTLLLSARQDLIPRPFLLEVLGEMAKFDFLQDFRGLRYASAMGCVRIGHCPSKCARRHIWPL